MHDAQKLKSHLWNWTTELMREKHVTNPKMLLSQSVAQKCFFPLKTRAKWNVKSSFFTAIIFVKRYSAFRRITAKMYYISTAFIRLMKRYEESRPTRRCTTNSLRTMPCHQLAWDYVEFSISFFFLVRVINYNNYTRLRQKKKWQ